MKKFMKVVSLALVAVALVACSTEEEKTFTKTIKVKDNKMVETVKLYGTDDYLDKTEATITMTFGNKKTATEELKATKKEWELEKKKSTKYVNYKFTEKKNVFEIKEVVEYKKAREDKKQVFKGEFLTSREYYSFSKNVSNYEKEGYKEVK